MPISLSGFVGATDLVSAAFLGEQPNGTTMLPAAKAPAVFKNSLLRFYNFNFYTFRHQFLYMIRNNGYPSLHQIFVLVPQSYFMHNHSEFENSKLRKYHLL